MIQTEKCRNATNTKTDGISNLNRSCLIGQALTLISNQILKQVPSTRIIFEERELFTITFDSEKLWRKEGIEG